MGDLQPDGLTMVDGVYQLTYQGLTLTLSSWAEKRRMSAGKLKERVRAGWTPAEALGFEQRQRSHESYDYLRRRLTYDGRTQFLGEWAKERKLNPNRIVMRLAHGWPLDQALGFVPRKPERKPRTNQLKEFAGLRVVIKTIEMIDRKAMGKQAREIRKKAGKTLRQAAADMGTTISGIDHLEIGRRNWTPELIEKFNRVAAGWVVQSG